jgi:pheromone a factor receptor
MLPVQRLALELDRWAIVISAFCFFGFFGFTDEARKNYRLLASTLAKSLGYTAFTERAATSDPPGVDVSLHFASHTFVTQQTESRGDSSSFSDRSSISAAVNECDVKLQPHSSVEELTSSNSPSLHIDIVPRVPEPVLELPLERMFVPDTTKAAHPNGALDQV